ncbi:MAG: hypothetical protein EOM62_22215 [Bacteroidia bacterium]|nr:hypothetical protein [Bacteroidia bacterium]
MNDDRVREAYLGS